MMMMMNVLPPLPHRSTSGQFGQNVTLKEHTGVFICVVSCTCSSHCCRSSSVFRATVVQRLSEA